MRPMLIRRLVIFGLNFFGDCEIEKKTGEKFLEALRSDAGWSLADMYDVATQRTVFNRKVNSVTVYVYSCKSRFPRA